MKLIVGLGNPGEKYAQTRHNVGWSALDSFAQDNNLTFTLDKKFEALVSEYRTSSNKALLVKPTTYMNLSGNALRKIVDYYKVDINNILIIVDDIYLDVGIMRLRESGSHGGQNGLKSVESHLGTSKYKRIKIGIGLNNQIPLDHHVLSKFSNTEKKTVNNLFIDTSLIIDMFVKDIYFKDIMTQFNTKYNELKK